MLTLREGCVVFYCAAAVVWHMSYVAINVSVQRPAKYEEFSSEGWQLTGIRVPQKWCHEGEVGSKPKKKPGRGTLRQGFPRGRLKAFRVSDLVSFLCCPLVTYDKTAFAIRDLTEERC